MSKPEASGCQGKDAPEGWWRDARTLRAEHDAHGTLQKAIAYHGGPSYKTITLWWHRLGLPLHEPGPKTGSLHAHTATPSTPEDNDGWLLDAMRKRRWNATLEELADDCDVSPRRVREAAERLSHAGYSIDFADTPGGAEVTLQKVFFPSDKVHCKLFEGEEIKFAVLGDTHLGSKQEALAELHAAYSMIAAEEIDTVFHLGDLVCGKEIFRGQLMEVKIHSYEEMVDYAVENYPRQEGVTTRIIAGNHDLEGAFGQVGANPVKAFTNRRDDFEYLGEYRAIVQLEQGTRLYFLHPKGGLSYAASYRPQKLAESFESGTKPNIAFFGHWHRKAWFEWRSVQMLLTGCFEHSGVFGDRLGLGEPSVGFWIVKLTIADDGSVVRMLPEWFPMYHGRRVAVA